MLSSPTVIPCALALVALLAAAGDDVPGATSAQPLPDDASLLAPLEPGLEGVLVLSDGRTYTGKVLELRRKTLAFKLEDRSFLEVPLGLARGVIRTVVPHGSQGGKTTRRVVLADGGVLAADAIEAAGDGNTTLVTGAARRTVPSADVRAIVEVHEERRPVALASWHLLAPTAFLPEGGELLAAARLTDLSATAGLMGLATLQAGTTIPAQHTRPYGANAQVALRAGLPVFPWLRVAAGLHADVSSAGHLLAASGTVTAGSATRHVTLHAAPVPAGANRLAKGVGRTGVALAGTWVLDRRWAAVAEGWASRRDGEAAGLVTLAGRFRAGRVGLELGAGRSFPDGNLFPWVSATVDATVW